MKKFVLLIGETGALLVPPLATLPALFARHEQEAETKALLSVCHDHPNIPIILLADTMAQEFRRDTLPPLGFLDRSRLVQRRLQQHFPEPSSLKAFVSLKKNSVLYACVHLEGPLAFWLEKIQNLSNPFHGVLPLPLLGPKIVFRLVPEPKGWLIFLSFQKTGGIRQIVMRDGAFVFTRLTQHNSSLAQDIQSLRNYLSRFGLTAREPLQVIALVSNSFHVEKKDFGDSVLDLLVLTPSQALQKLGCSCSLQSKDCDFVFALLAAKRRILHPLLLPEKQKRSLMDSKIKKLGSACAAFVWFLVLCLLAWHSYQLFGFVKQNRQAARALSELQQSWEKERAALVPITEPLGRLRQAVARQRLFSEPHLLQWPVLQNLNQEISALGRVTDLDWQYSDCEIIRLTVSLDKVEKNADPQEVVRQIDLLAQSLHKASSVFQVVVTRYPFLIKQDETMSNSKDSHLTSSEPPTAEFTLRRGKQ